MNILYSTGCPRCNVIIKKLTAAGIEFQENSNVEEMKALGIDAVPVLRVGDELMDFTSTLVWISKQGVSGK